MSERPWRLPLALTMGEPAGIGGEITLKAWLRRDEGLSPFFVIDDPQRLKRLAAHIGLDVPVAGIASPDQAGAIFKKALPVLPERLPAPVVSGKPDGANAAAVVTAIERAVELTRHGHAAAVVTNPIHKKCLYDAGFRYPGHTEYLAALAGGGLRPVMMLACAALRVVPVTVHTALRDAIAALTTAEIVRCGEVTAAALRRDFGVDQPAIAVAGLNPHAGEDGSLGREEIEIIRPAVEALKAQGIAATGPAPADTLFHERIRSAYDAVICMYHDQALIPLKTIDFDRGVNITLGLPFVRTSPDHGTALEIAGTGAANEHSLVAALHAAAAMACQREISAAAIVRGRRELNG
ncbi:MAG: 4-hydroxythreonine-4-phosphate dehydrogenase PdxA [Alphaproteobacteria bacterium]